MHKTEKEDEQLCEESECIELCKKIQKKKCPGPDGISYEAFIYAGKDMVQSTTRMLNTIWKTEEIPDQWKRSDIKPIYKGKGTKQDLANYRGIFLSSVVCKLFEKMIYKKLEPIIDKKMTEHQAGARKGRRTADHIQTLKAKLEYDQYIVT